LLTSADATFSDLEVVIKGPRAGAPTRSDPSTTHSADGSVIDCLKTLGINMLATSNNHAFDLGTGGIIDTLAAVRSRGVVHAGSGFTLAEASAPGFLSASNGRIALVAFSTGMVRPGGAATSYRPGVAEIRRREDGAMDAEDVQRTLSAISTAAAIADVVIAYQHNHYWEAENWKTPHWQRQLARQCVDAGAGAFVAHGAPLLQGLEMYRGRPLFHGLGSFIFQTEKAPDFYGPWAWQSLIASCRFANGQFAGAELIPLQLYASGIGGTEDLATRGRPALAASAEAAIIIDRIASLSRDLGFDLRHDGRTALLTP
jgi:poly-gamma-glutamate capsule biosynthesis protein CapA/YwtB (metallophosphatase superfamily)